MSSGKYWISNNYIYGPKESGRFWISGGYIYGPRNSGKYWISGNYIYGPKHGVSFGLVEVISTGLLGWNCLGCHSAAAILSPSGLKVARKWLIKKVSNFRQQKTHQP